MSFKWPLINDNITQEDKEVLAEFILSSNRFTNGPQVKKFEEAWSKWLGVKYSVMVNSGASANYITMAITRELKGQYGEVIVPPIGWVSDVSSVINTGFTPVFVDIDKENLAISYNNVAGAINKNTRAIVLVHALGFNGLNEKLIKLAQDNNLLLIEDCCESHGATYEGSRVGSVGHMSCFSFYFGHHITTIEGGVVCTDDPAIYQLARMFRSHGMTREASKEIQERYAHPTLNPLFTFAVPGYNMRSSELNAVLGLQQMGRLDHNIQARRQNLDTWLSHLNTEKYFTGFDVVGNSSFALPLVLNNADPQLLSRVCRTLEEEGVEYRLGTAGGGNQARQPYLKNYDFIVFDTLTNADFIHENSLYVGNHTDLTQEQISSLCEQLNNL